MPHISANQLSKRSVIQFFDTLLSRPSLTQALPDTNKKFEGHGTALMIDGELRGLYSYSAFSSFEANTVIYYCFGGMLGADLDTVEHRELIRALLNQLRTGSKIQVVICLNKQPMVSIPQSTLEQAFWFDLGFSLLDVQVFYQGKVNTVHPHHGLDFSVMSYAGGDEAINVELRDLYREAYKKRKGIPDISIECIEKQLANHSCSYLIMWHHDFLIGQATLYIANKECYVDSIHIKRKYWGTGASDVLTKYVFSYAKNHNCETVSGTAASNNWGSRRLMERFGLVAQHQTPRMVLDL